MTQKLTAAEAVERLIEDIDMPKLSTKEMVAQAVTQILKDRWKPKSITKLAIELGVTPETVHRLKKDGVETATPTLEGICRKFRISIDDILQHGEIVTENPSHSELVDLIPEMVGTEYEQPLIDLVKNFRRLLKSRSS